MASRLFGVRCRARPLPSYVDQNFQLRCEPSGEKLVLKISNAAESAGKLDLEHRTMAALAENGCALQVPRLRRTLAGEPFGRAEGEGGRQHLVRVLTFVPGTLLENVRTHSGGLLQDLGRRLAEVDVALLGLTHPAARREMMWDCAQVGLIRPHTRYLRRPGGREQAEAFLDRFERRVAPVLPELRSSIIHSDANIHNVLVKRAGDDYRLCGLIDFGDVIHAPTVCEPAIAAAYAALGKTDPLAAAANVVRGYDERLPLGELEIHVLYDLILARLWISVTCSARGQVLDPDNDYRRICERPIWDVIDKLSSIPVDEARAVFQEACSRPSPARSFSQAGRTAPQAQLSAS